MGLETTAQLLEATLDGDQAAQEDLLERLRPRLVLWAGTRVSAELRAWFEPEDVAQETLLAIHRSLDQFKGRDQRSFFAWVFKIAENRLRDLAIHRNALKRRLPEPVSLTVTSPSSGAARDEQVTRVRTALAALSPDHQEVIRLRRLQGLPLAEVAAIMDRSANAISTLYFRAIQALGTELRE